jgi:polysaccharide export outer membrane protein
MPSSFIRSFFGAATVLVALGTVACTNLAEPVATTKAEAASVPVREFRLGSGDKIRVVVFGADKLGGEYTVELDGSVSLPLIGVVPASGGSLADLQGRIATRLRQEKLVDDPQVSVELLETRPFYILGEVEKPGEYPYRAGLNVISAVATAGGFKYRADQDYIYLRRAGEQQEAKVPMASAAPVYPGDIVRVPGRFF